LGVGMLVVAGALGACINAPVLMIGARSTFGTGDRGPLRTVMLCGLDWSRPTRSTGTTTTADSIGHESEVEGALEDSGGAGSECIGAALCEWEAREREATLLRTLAISPEAAP